eukprot:1140771-Pelagomonas_calceolata.AAC.2
MLTPDPTNLGHATFSSCLDANSVRVHAQKVLCSLHLFWCVKGVGAYQPMRDLARQQCGYLQALAARVMANYDLQAAAAASAQSTGSHAPAHAPAAEGAGGGGGGGAGASERSKKKRKQQDRDCTHSGGSAVADGRGGAGSGSAGQAEDFCRLQVATSAALCAMLELDYRCGCWILVGLFRMLTALCFDWVKWITCASIPDASIPCASIP